MSETNDTEPTLMGRYIGPHVSVTRIALKGGIKLTAQPSPGKTYPVKDVIQGGWMILLKVSETVDKWVLTERVQQFWLLPDGTELEALE